MRKISVNGCHECPFNENSNCIRHVHGLDVGIYAEQQCVHQDCPLELDLYREENTEMNIHLEIIEGIDWEQVERETKKLLEFQRDYKKNLHTALT